MKKFLFLLLTVLLLVGCSTKNSSEALVDVANGGFSAKQSYAVEEAEYDYVDESKYSSDDNSFEGSKLIYSSHMSLETKKYDEAKAQLMNTLKKFEHIIDNQNERDYNDYWYSTSNRRVSTCGRILDLEIRVPVTNFDEVLTELNSLENVHVTASSVNSSDMTKTYNDNANKIETLNIQEARLNELLSQANNVSEILEIEDRLAMVRYELKQLNDRNSSIDYDVQYSQISINLKEVAKFTAEYNFFDRLKDTLGESWINFTDFIKNSILLVVSLIPFIIFALIVYAVINFVLKKLGKEKLTYYLVKLVNKINYKVVLAIFGILLILIFLYNFY